MIRPATVAAVALGFLTALAVGVLGLLISGSNMGSAPASVQNQDAVPVAEAFYSGVNAWLSSGDRSLERVLASEFVDHTGSGAPDRNGAEFLDQLTAMRTALPSLRFDVLEIEAGGSIVSVELIGVPGRFSTIDGWSLALPAQQPFREILRIEAHEVVERWSSDELWPSDLVSIERTLPIGVDANRQPSLQRFTLDPESAAYLIASGTVVLWVESGELEIELTGWDQAGNLKFPTEPLAAGSLRIVKPTGEIRLRALGPDRVELVTVSLHTILLPGDFTGQFTNDVPSGLRQDASVTLAIQLIGREAGFSVSVLTLPAGSTLSMSAATLHEVMVIDGALEIESENGDIFFCFGRSRSRLLNGLQKAVPGQGFATQTGRPAIYQVVGSEPATLVLLTIQPASTPDQPIRTGQP